MNSNKETLRFSEKSFKWKVGSLVITLLFIMLFSFFHSIYNYKLQSGKVHGHIQDEIIATGLLTVIQLNAEFRGIGLRVLSEETHAEPILKLLEKKRLDLITAVNELSHYSQGSELQKPLAQIKNKIQTVSNGDVLGGMFTASEWMDYNNALIESEIDLVSFVLEPEGDQGWIEFFLALQRDVSYFIHYAGLERAYISSNINISDDVFYSRDLFVSQSDLEFYESRYDLYRQKIEDVKLIKNIPVSIKNDIDKFLDLYNGEYKGYRAKLISSNFKGEDVSKWWSLATQLIDSAKQVSQKASDEISINHIASLSYSIDKKLYILIAEFFIVLVLFVVIVGWLAALLLKAVRDLKEEAERSQKYAYAIDSSPLGILIADPEGNVEFANKSYLNDMLIGKGAVPKHLNELSFNSEELGQLQQYFEIQSVWNGEIKYDSDENQSTYDVLSAPIYETETGSFIGNSIIFNDVSEQKQLQSAILSYQASLESKVQERTRELEVSEARTRAIVDMAVNAIITIDRRGRIGSLNKAAEQMFGYQPEELIGKNIATLMPEPYSSEHDNYLMRYQQQGKPFVIGSIREVEALRRNGEIFPISLSVSEVKSGDEHFFVGMVNDISERKAFEESLRIAKETAERVSQIKSSFLANMSHELRTPMNGVIGMTEVVLETDLNDDQRKHLKIALDSAKSLLSILNEVLDLAKLEDGRMTLSRIDFSLPSLLSESLNALRFSAENKGLEFSVECSPNLADWFNGDSMRIRQVLINLVGNAVKFTSQGFIKISVLPVSPNRVRFEVADSGIGIAADRLDQIFESFAQADDGISRRYGGSGLGTTISKQLVELMGGDIYVESTQGKGSIFSFELPLRPVNPDIDAVTTHDSAEQPDDSSHDQLNILVAEDQLTNQELVKIRLEGKGHTVTVVEDGIQAVEAVKAGDYDLVLMDGHMPHLDGYDATKAIRQYERESNISATPVVALTASVMQQDRQRCYESGMNGFVGKPINFDELFETIAEVIDTHKSTVPSTNLSPELADVDFDAGLSIWQGAEDVYHNALLKFSNNLESELEGLKEAVSNNDIPQIKHVAHTLKGAASNLKLLKVTELSKQVELAVALDDVDPTKLHALVAQLFDAAHALGSVLVQGVLCADDEVETRVDIKDPQAILVVLKEMEFEISNGQARPETLMTLNQQLSSAELARLKESLDTFDFEAAADAVRELIDSIETVVE